MKQDTVARRRRFEPWFKSASSSPERRVGLAYDSGNDLLHGLQTESGGTAATTLLQFNAKGALLGKTRLSNPIPVGRYPFPLAQLAWAEKSLICLVSPSPEDAPVGVTTARRTYLIDPRSGECRPVRSGFAAVTP